MLKANISGFENPQKLLPRTQVCIGIKNQKLNCSCRYQGKQKLNGSWLADIQST